MRYHNYSKVFTVSKEEGIWYTFFRERGYIYLETNFTDYELGKKYIVPYIAINSWYWTI